jgi:hypothetical protein
MDPYITITEVAEFVEGLLPSSDPDRAAWEAVESEADKTAFLSQAMLRIESLRYAGRPADVNQLVCFPRTGQLIVPDEVKQALALEACACASFITDTDARQREKLQTQGVKAFSAGRLSESYGPRSGRTNLRSEMAQYLLTPYLAGGVRIV